MATLMNKVRQLTSRQILLGLHGFAFVVAFSGLIDTLVNTSLETVGGELRKLYDYLFLVPALSLSLTSSLLMLIVGWFSSSLHQESSMIVHGSVVLWMVHLKDYSQCQAQMINGNVTSIEVILHDRVPSSMALNLILIVIYSAQVVLSSRLLRRNGSKWPRFNFMQLFTLDALFLGFRFGVAFVLLVLSVGYYYPGGKEQVTPAFYNIMYFSAVFSFLVIIESILSVLWGVIHRKMMAVQTLLSSLLTGITAITTFVMMKTNDIQTDVHSDVAVWSSVSFAIGFVYGILCLKFPALLTSPPKALKIFRQYNEKANTEEIVTSKHRRSAECSGSDGDSERDVNYGRLYSNISDSTSIGEVPAVETGSKLSIVQLFRTSRPFLRNFVYLCLIVLIISFEGHYLTVQRQSHFRMWGPRVILCSTVSLLLRCFPQLVVQLVTRTKLPDPVPAKLAASAVLEMLLSVIGILGTYIDVWHAEITAHTGATVALVVVLLQCVELNGMLHVVKRSTTTTSAT